MRERLWLSIYLADLEDPRALTRLAVDHCLTPARDAWGLPAPAPHEGDSAFFEEEIVDGNRVQVMREHGLTVTAAHFEPVFRGLLLFGWLFPAATMLIDTPEELAKTPGPAFLSDSQLLAYRTYEEVEYMAAGMLGIRMDPPLYHGQSPYSQKANPEALSDLR